MNEVKTHQTLVNIDYALLSFRGRLINSDVLKNEGFELIGRTQVMEQIWTDGKYHISQGVPEKSALAKDLILIKIENELLYAPDFTIWKHINHLQAFFQIKFKGFSRLDIALDFQEFTGITIADFISKYTSGRIQKKGRANWNIVAKLNGSGRLTPEKVETMRWGSMKSGFRYYMYNKTLELKQKKDKPYIRELWEKNGFDPDKTTWRLEFVLTGDQFAINKGSELAHFTMKEVQTDPDKVFKISGIEVTEPYMKTLIAQQLIARYFTWLTCTGKKKQNEKEIPLFDLSTIPYTEKLCKVVTSDETRSRRIFVKHIYKHMQALHTGEGLIPISEKDTLFDYVRKFEMYEYLQKLEDENHVLYSIWPTPSRPGETENEQVI